MKYFFSKKHITQKTQNFNIYSFFIFIIYVYFLIPTEASLDGNSATTAILIRLFFCTTLIIILSFFVLNNFIISNKLILIFILLLCISLITGIIGYHFRILVTVLLSLFLGILWVCAISKKPSLSKNLTFSLYILIYFSFCSILLQHIIYNFYEYIDFHSLVFPWSEARYEEYDLFIRLGGIYIEPGTLSNWVYAFLLLATLLKGHIDIKLTLISALAMAISLSAWGVAISILIFFFLFIHKGIIQFKDNKLYLMKKTFIFSLIFGISAIVFFILFLTDDIVLFLQTKFSFQTGSGQGKLDFYDEFLLILPEIIFLGKGYASNFCLNCSSPQDAGLFLNFTVVYSLFFAIVFFSIILYAFYKINGIQGIILALPLLLTKIYYWDFIVILIFFTAFYRIFFSKKI